MAPACTQAQSTIYLKDHQNLQEIVDSAPEYAEIICDLNDTIRVSTTIVVDKPLTIKGLQAILPDSIGNMPLLQANAEGFVFIDFILHGNAQTVSQEIRAPLLVIKGNNFTVERGKFFHSSKEGVSIEADVEDLTGGVVRDIYGKGVMRDLVSLNGGYGGKKVRNILVENIRCDSCVLRGAVEVSNGTDNITVRKVYAGQSAYAVDVQDHRREFQVNQNIVLEDIFAIDCKMALRTANADYGHHNLTVRNITAVRCDWPIDISHTNQVTLENVTIMDHNLDKNPPVKIENCHGVAIENVKIKNTGFAGAAVEIINSSGLLLDGMILQGENTELSQAISYEINNGGEYHGLIINNVIASEKGILLDASDEKGTLTGARISNSLVKVENKAGFEGVEIR
ncbi:MAG: hypothetical protein ACOCXH_16325 [Cyclobacteriaceae bacterium]